MDLKTAIETIQNETHREKNNFKNKQHISELRDYIKQPYINVISFQNNSDKKVFFLIIVKIFSKFTENYKPTDSCSSMNPRKTNMKKLKH